jgi:hypothetical protein
VQIFIPTKEYICFWWNGINNILVFFALVILTAFVLQSVHSTNILQSFKKNNANMCIKQLLVTNILLWPLFCLWIYIQSEYYILSATNLSTGFYCSKSVAVQAQIPNLLEMDCFYFGTASYCLILRINFNNNNLII